MFLIVKTDYFSLGTTWWYYLVVLRNYFWVFYVGIYPNLSNKKIGDHISTRLCDMVNLRFWDIYKYSAYVYTQYAQMSKIKGPHISTPKWVSIAKFFGWYIGAVSNTKHQNIFFSDPHGVTTAISSLFSLVDHFPRKLDFGALLVGKIWGFKILAQHVDFRSWKFQEICFFGREVRIRGDLELIGVLSRTYGQIFKYVHFRCL